MNKLFLLDAFALIFRAHYAFIKRPLINSKGMNTSAVQGFLNSLLEVLEKEEPSHVAVAFDLPGATFRNDLFSDYKANRDETPEDIVWAVPYIKDILEGMNIHTVAAPGYEADDVIGTLAKQAEAKGFEVYMMTPDKDYGQLVSERIKLYKPAAFGNQAEIWGVQEVLEKWGVKRPLQVIDMLGLQGDPVDNIPGVPGIGPKNAKTLLEKFDTVEGVIANVHQLQGRQREAIERHAAQALLSKQLAAIELSAPVLFEETAFERRAGNREVLEPLFRELELRSLSQRILRPLPVSAASVSVAVDTSKTESPPLQGSLFETPELIGVGPPASTSLVPNHIGNTPHEYHLVQTLDELSALVGYLSTQQAFCFDTETTGLNPNEAELVGVSFCAQAHKAYYLPVPADYNEAIRVLAPLKSLFERSDLDKVGQNMKYDALVLRRYGIEIAGQWWDTMLMHYLLEPEKRHNMNYMSEVYLQYAPIAIETLIGKGKSARTMREVPVAAVCDYAAEDADVTWQLYEQLRPMLEAEPNLLRLYHEVEAPLCRVLVDIEAEGVHIDTEFLRQYSQVLASELDAARQKVLEAAGISFNLDSPKQIGEVLFERLQLPYRWRKTKTEAYSTDEDKLSELAEEHPIAADILSYRSLAKLKSTYVDALPLLVNPHTGRVHTSLNQALTATGRLSSQNPNLQNIPVRTERGREIRKAFIPRNANYQLIAADYSQIELRLMAAIAYDEAMLDAFRQGKDIHAATAARIYGLPIEQVTKEQRYNAKTVNFSIIYGAGAVNLSRNLGIKRAEAQELIHAYFEQYKGIKRYMKEVVEEARRNGYVTTLLGRRRPLRDLHSQNQGIRAQAERLAINTPIQGSAADLIKVAMVNIRRALQEQELRTRMVLQVHDELLFDAPKQELAAVLPLIVQHMKNAMPSLPVPLEVSIQAADNWLEAH